MKKISLNYIITSLLIFIGVVFMNSQTTLAQIHILEGTANQNLSADRCDPNSEDNKQYCGNYQLNDFVVLGIKITQIMLGLVGTLAFGAFIYGGVMFLVSAGRKDYVDKGKSAMINAVIGLIIVFSSYMIIQFTLETLGYLENGRIKDSSFGNEVWNQPPK